MDVRNTALKLHGHTVSSGGTFYNMVMLSVFIY